MTTAEAAVAEPKFGPQRNPIFNRELVTMLRSRKSFALLIVYLVVSSALVLAAWPTGGESLLVQGQISRQVFSLFALAQTILLALLIPATLGTCMTMEKEGETIDLLLTTPVSADSIVIGKLLSGLFYFLLLALVSVPVLLLCFVIGGLAAEDVLGLYIFLFLQALVYGLTSVCCSIYLHRTHIAVILAYVFVGMEAVMMKALYGEGIGFLGSDSWAGMSVTGGALLIGLYIGARSGARQPYTPVRKTMEEEDLTNAVGLIIRRDSYPDKLIVPERRNVLMEDGRNPVLDKELQAGIYGSGSLFVRLMIQLGMFLSLAAFFWTLGRGVEEMRSGAVSHPEYIYFCFIVGYMMVISPSIAARTFTHEKEERTIESLMITLIPRRTIVLGKFAAIVRVVGALTMLNCVPFLIIIFFSSFNFAQLLAMGMLIVTVTVFTTAAGMAFSLASRTTLAAMISTYFLLFAMYVGPVLAETFLTTLFPEVSLESFAFLTYVSPLLACRVPPAGGEARQIVQLLIHGLASLAVSLLFLVLMIRSFERMLVRQGQKLL